MDNWTELNILIKHFYLDLEYDHLDYSRPIQPQIPHYHRTTSSATTFSRDRESNQSNEKVSMQEANYDAPATYPKKLNINVPPLPSKNQPKNIAVDETTNLQSSTSSNSSSQDENIDAMIVIDKPTNKNVLQQNELDK